MYYSIYRAATELFCTFTHRLLEQRRGIQRLHRSSLSNTRTRPSFPMRVSPEQNPTPQSVACNVTNL